MGDGVSTLGSRGRRWAARLAVAAAVAGVVLLLVVAGVQTLGLVGIGLAGLVVTTAAGWWVVATRGLVRGLAVVLAVAAPAAVIALWVAADLLWVVLVALALWALAVSFGWAALREDRVPPVAEWPATMAERPFLVVNPRAGGGKAARFGLAEKAKKLGAEVVLLDAAHPQDVAELARAAIAAGADLVGVAGGDGTQALVAQVAADHGIPFLVVPAGTRNHFALDLGLDRSDPAASLDALTDGVELRVDLGSIGDRVFVNNVSLGAYAAVVQSPAYREDKIRTILRLLPDVLTHHRGPRLTAHAEGRTLAAPQAVLVSNNPYRVGDLAGLGRRQRLDTGALGMLGLQVDNAAQATRLLSGRRAPGLTVLTAREVVIDADAPEIQAGVDGEALTLRPPVHCTIRPRALRVLVPRVRPGIPRERPRLNWRRLYELALSR